MSGPEPGDFGLVGRQSGPWLDRLADALIRFGTKSPVDHAVLYLGDGWIAEAVMPRVRLMPVTEYAGITWSTGRLGALTPDDRQRKSIVQAAESYLGTPYNLADIAAIALAQRRMGAFVDGDEWWVKRLSDNRRVICSQLVDSCYAKAGVHLFRDRLPGLVSPADLYRLLGPVSAAA